MRHSGQITIVLLCAVAVASAVSSPAKHPPRIIVQLEDPPRTLSRSDRQSAARNIQDRFLGTVKRNGFQLSSSMNQRGDMIDSRFSEVLNAVSIVAPEDSNVDELIQGLRTRPDVVGAWADGIVYENLFTSLPQVGTAVAWAELENSGLGKPGKGIKFASVDGGATKLSPMLSGDGFEWPEDIPAPGLGETENCNGKIIVARAYFSPYDPPRADEVHTWPGPLKSSHGIHTTSTAVGVPVTLEINGEAQNISGVAPYAWAMIYRVFYVNLDGSTVGRLTENLAAWEDAVKDGAQVISNSWGDGAFRDARDFIAAYADKATKEHGVFFVFSAGNDGPNLGTVDHSGTADVVRVASSTTSKSAGWAVITSPSLQPTNSLKLFAVNYYVGTLPNKSLAFSNWPLAAVSNASLACNSMNVSFSGKAVVIQGANFGCDAETKVNNLADAGAQVVIMISAKSTKEAITLSKKPVTALSIGKTGGDILLSFALATPNATMHAGIYTESATSELLSSFSSCGPTVDNNIGPDVSAPGGISIVAAGYDVTAPSPHYGFGYAQGTSMSCPHVSGAAVLIRQANPNFSPAEIKSALMTTASLNVLSVDGLRQATPLQVGSGRLSISRAINPSLFLQPQTVTFSLVPVMEQRTIAISVLAYHDLENISISLTNLTGFPFILDKFSVSPSSISSLKKGGSAQISVSFLGSNQTKDWMSYVVLSNSSGNDIAHAPIWARTILKKTTQIALLDMDWSDCNDTIDDVSGIYQAAFESAGYSTRLFSSSYKCNSTFIFPKELEFGTFDALVVFTGNKSVLGRPTLSSFRTAITSLTSRGTAFITIGSSIDKLWSNTAKTPVVFLCGTTFNTTTVNVSKLMPLKSSPSFFSNTSFNIAIPQLAPSLSYDEAFQEIPILGNGGHVFAKAYVNQEIPLQPTFLSKCGVMSIGFEALSENDRVFYAKSIIDLLNQSAPNMTLITGSMTAKSATLKVDIMDPSFKVEQFWVLWGDDSAIEIFNASSAVSHNYSEDGEYMPILMVKSSFGRVFKLNHSALFNISTDGSSTVSSKNSGSASDSSQTTASSGNVIDTTSSKSQGSSTGTSSISQGAKEVSSTGTPSSNNQDTEEGSSTGTTSSKSYDAEEASSTGSSENEISGGSVSTAEHLVSEDSLSFASILLASVSCFFVAFASAFVF